MNGNTMLARLMALRAEVAALHRDVEQFSERVAATSKQIAMLYAATLEVCPQPQKLSLRRLPLAAPSR